MTMKSLPAACVAVLNAPSPVSEAAVTVRGIGSPPPTIAASSAPTPVTANAFTEIPLDRIPIPMFRPDPGQ